MGLSVPVKGTEARGRGVPVVGIDGKERGRRRGRGAQVSGIAGKEPERMEKAEKSTGEGRVDGCIGPPKGRAGWEKGRRAEEGTTGLQGRRGRLSRRREARRFREGREDGGGNTRNLTGSLQRNVTEMGPSVGCASALGPMTLTRGASTSHRTRRTSEASEATPQGLRAAPAGTCMPESATPWSSGT